MTEYSLEALRVGFPHASGLICQVDEVYPLSSWDKLRDSMVELALKEPWRKLRYWIPALGVCNAPLDLERFCQESDVEPPKTRTCTVTRSIAVTGWSSLGDFSVAEMTEWKGAGKVTTQDILRICFEFGLRQLPSSPSSHHERVPQSSVSNAEVDLGFPTEAVKLLGAWVTALQTRGRLADLAALVDAAPLPKDIRAAIERLLEWDLRTTATSWTWLQADLSSLTEGFDDRELRVFEDRVLGMSSLTLEQIGSSLGLTRERVRQIAESLRERVLDRLQTAPFRRLGWLAFEVVHKSGGVLSNSDGDTTWPCYADALAPLDERLRRAFLIFACRMELDEGCWVLTELRDVRQSIIENVLAIGSLSRLEIIARLPEQSNTATALEYLGATKQARWFGDTLLRATGTIEEVAMLVLRNAGHPLPLEIIHQRITAGWRPGSSESSVRNALLVSKRISRCSNHEWALNEWGLAQYSGVADSIQREIEAAGGVCYVPSMISSIAASGRVAEATVRAYLKAPRFVLENSGTEVRLRRTNEPFAVLQKLTEVAGVFVHGPSRVSWFFELTDENFRGSGRVTPMVLAKQLALVPNGERVFATDTGRTIRVTWPDTAWQGPYLGSIRESLEELHCGRDDCLRIDFDVMNWTARTERILRVKPAAGEEISWLASRTGCDGLTEANAMELISKAMGVAHVDVLAILGRRGDDLIAGVLQDLAADDSGFGEGLDYLGGILD